ncbi:MAG: hypothetical protein K8F91_06600 [Candidatus Obscuribacterales bacterium]|nr:hypothetical protein [Candidatus Obscuribacterales bacterium]
MAEMEKARRQREQEAMEKADIERQERRKKEDLERRRRKEDHERYRMQQMAVKKQKAKKLLDSMEAEDRTKKLVESLDRKKQENEDRGFEE